MPSVSSLRRMLFVFTPLLAIGLAAGGRAIVQAQAPALQVVASGLDNPRGCIVGGFALGLLESGVALWSAEWREIVIFLLIILVLAVRPNGLFGAQSLDKV